MLLDDETVDVGPYPLSKYGSPSNLDLFLSARSREFQEISVIAQIDVA
jgi:hypothetical protein